VSGEEPEPADTRRRVDQGLLICFALTALAGWIDAIGFLRLGGFYPSFMSGNTTQLGIVLSELDWRSAALPGLLVALFVLGVFTGGVIDRSVTRFPLVLNSAIETLLIVAAIGLSQVETHAALALAPLPIAMGLQNVVAYRFATGSVGITFVTGTLVRLGEALAEAVVRGRGQWSRPALTWLAMAAGAVGGATAHAVAAPLELALPAMGAAIAAVLAYRMAISGRQVSRAA
jgi:uncharacterized membrane protein YoaK (UPF0700 family)